jgi:hypothetical protein
MAVCVTCGAVLSGRSDRRHCSPRCRVAAHRERRQGERELRLRLVEDVATIEPDVAEAALVRAAAGDWRAAAFLLERQYPERYGIRYEPHQPADLWDDD